MRSDPAILAFDTSAAHCAAALLFRGEILQAETREMGRGQAEALMPLLEDVLEAAHLGWKDLDAIAVGIGPGNFTGIRISVSAARGLALALGIPAVGVSTFDLMAYGQTGAELLVSLPAPRDQVYLQPFHHGTASGPARLADPATLPGGLGLEDGGIVTGHRAEEIARSLGAQAAPAELEEIPHRIARIAAERLAGDGVAPERPAPLYVRAADAAPPSDPPPVILP
ncbi:tRNA (adenosine(37)-N6)-threonylcarbamoyltransferase complex dimerization subunit type 1 TsaB [Tropicimonas aquimaris]|uniref:tRNA (Adenosine(37)-N6)-threonylcarbamoyltransferase complex dimerization subunit type 1 TsaB n=1 Tax=Tropicimonas aquimaris TaxID=914152 RepID=A0ABW3IK32_9RHOB